MKRFQLQFEDIKRIWEFFEENYHATITCVLDSRFVPENPRDRQRVYRIVFCPSGGTFENPVKTLEFRFSGDIVEMFE